MEVHLSHGTHPKRHHYVPRFYLERFADPYGRVWTLDKSTDKVFAANPVKLARETGFYEAPAVLCESGQVPIEASLSRLEADVSRIFAAWRQAIDGLEPGSKIVEDSDREIVSVYLAIQAFRTSEQRVLLEHGLQIASPDTDLRNIHIALLASGYWRDAALAIRDFIWILGRNSSGSPFYTSDHPVVLRGQDRRCLHISQLPTQGGELIFPLSPTSVLYGYESRAWGSLARFDGCLSPVRFTQDLVASDNQPQVAHSRRFVFCDRNAFTYARAFCAEHPTVGDPNRRRFGA